jgi:hypothetical protein
VRCLNGKTATALKKHGNGFLKIDKLRRSSFSERAAAFPNRSTHRFEPNLTKIDEESSLENSSTPVASLHSLENDVTQSLVLKLNDSFLNQEQGNFVNISPVSTGSDSCFQLIKEADDLLVSTPLQKQIAQKFLKFNSNISSTSSRSNLARYNSLTSLGSDERTSNSSESSSHSDELLFDPFIQRIDDTYGLYDHSVGSFMNNSIETAPSRKKNIKSKFDIFKSFVSTTVKGKSEVFNAVVMANDDSFELANDSDCKNSNQTIKNKDSVNNDPSMICSNSLSYSQNFKVRSDLEINDLQKFLDNEVEDRISSSESRKLSNNEQVLEIDKQNLDLDLVPFENLHVDGKASEGNSEGVIAEAELVDSVTNLVNTTERQSKKTVQFETSDGSQINIHVYAKQVDEKKQNKFENLRPGYSDIQLNKKNVSISSKNHNKPVSVGTGEISNHISKNLKKSLQTKDSSDKLNLFGSDKNTSRDQNDSKINDNSLKFESSSNRDNSFKKSISDLNDSSAIRPTKVPSLDELTQKPSQSSTRNLKMLSNSSSLTPSFPRLEQGKSVIPKICIDTASATDRSDISNFTKQNDKNSDLTLPTIVDTRNLPKSSKKLTIGLKTGNKNNRLPKIPATEGPTVDESEKSMSKATGHDSSVKMLQTTNSCPSGLKIFLTSDSQVLPKIQTDLTSITEKSRLSNTSTCSAKSNNTIEKAEATVINDHSAKKSDYFDTPLRDSPCFNFAENDSANLTPTADSKSEISISTNRSISNRSFDETTESAEKSTNIVSTNRQGAKQLISFHPSVKSKNRFKPIEVFTELSLTRAFTFSYFKIPLQYSEFNRSLRIVRENYDLLGRIICIEKRRTITAKPADLNLCLLEALFAKLQVIAVKSGKIRISRVDYTIINDFIDSFTKQIENFNSFQNNKSNGQANLDLFYKPIDEEEQTAIELYKPNRLVNDRFLYDWYHKDSYRRKALFHHRF